MSSSGITNHTSRHRRPLRLLSERERERERLGRRTEEEPATVGLGSERIEQGWNKGNAGSDLGSRRSLARRGRPRLQTWCIVKRKRQSVCLYVHMESERENGDSSVNSGRRNGTWHNFTNIPTPSTPAGFFSLTNC